MKASCLSCRQPLFHTKTLKLKSFSSTKSSVELKAIYQCIPRETLRVAEDLTPSGSCVPVFFLKMSFFL